MGKVQLLDDHLVNKIAAGEVVARPASVLKELLENALDAGARRIEVEFEGGGIDLIRVRDDGEGMTAEDARMALERHATSKLRSEHDLDDIRTLGFRGEALPSIASVSRLEIRTRRHDADGGTRLLVDGGKVREEGPVGTTPGTSVEVRDLFFNTPARRKFLRSEATETRHLIDTVAETILGNPAVSFKLSAPGRPALLSSAGTGKLFDAMVAVLGASTARAMVPIGPKEHPALPYGVDGYISRPDVNRATRAGFHLYINGRPVQLAQMARAVSASYQAYLPKGRWPVAVLFVSAGPEAVDVNVHPQKLEVRLDQPERLAGLLGSAVKDALAGVRQPESVVPSERAPAGGEAGESRPLFSPGGWRRRVTLPYMPLPARSMDGGPPPEAVPASYPQPGTPFDPVSQDAMPGIVPGPLEPAEWAGLRVLGQVFRTFLVGTLGDKVYFIDQHTAHERVLYEENLEKILQRNVETQQLLLPQTIECPRRSEEELEETAALLRSCGFDCELFSGGTLVVKGVPVLERGMDVRAVMEELLSGETAGRRPLEERQEAVARTVSCRAAVKAGDTLTQPEMDAVVRDLARTRNPLRCPHGRPILLELTQDELKKLFERSW